MVNTEIAENMEPLRRSFRHARPGHWRDGTSIRIIADEAQMKPFYQNLSIYVDVELRGYNTESLLCQILEDYGMEHVVGVLNDLKSDNEWDWKIEITKPENELTKVV